MNKYQEIEVKFSLKNLEEVEQKLNEVGIQKQNFVEYQKDTYFIPEHRNFLKPKIVSEWLRIRETPYYASLNYKKWLPVGQPVQTHCKEYETKLDDVLAIKKIFISLDFKEIAVVEKERRTWYYKNTAISIDKVLDLGEFIVAEFMETVPEEQAGKVQDFLIEVLEEIGAETGPRDRRGYAYALISKKRGEQ